MTLLVSAVGSPETVERAMLKLIEVAQPDEIIAAAHLYDHRARLRSFELLAEVRSRLAARESGSDLGETVSSKAGGVTD
jgi:alkanesulfonate monooxygenase SsuD/methylene tetrahydromethanopterin reductase-like flavin-dependent oxidoreductase (luciferase family)